LNEFSNIPYRDYTLVESAISGEKATTLKVEGSLSVSVGIQVSFTFE
jgi:hypothetical protein